MKTPADPDLTVRISLRKSDHVTLECQLGAHWGCPGGLFHEGGRLDLPCNCQAEGCACPARR